MHFSLILIGSGNPITDSQKTRERKRKPCRTLRVYNIPAQKAHSRRVPPMPFPPLCHVIVSPPCHLGKVVTNQFPYFPHVVKRTAVSNIYMLYSSDCGRSLSQWKPHTITPSLVLPNLKIATELSCTTNKPQTRYYFPSC